MAPSALLLSSGRSCVPRPGPGAAAATEDTPVPAETGGNLRLLAYGSGRRHGLLRLPDHRPRFFTGGDFLTGFGFTGSGATVLGASCGGLGRSTTGGGTGIVTSDSGLNSLRAWRPAERVSPRASARGGSHASA